MEASLVIGASDHPQYHGFRTQQMREHVQKPSETGCDSNEELHRLGAPCPAWFSDSSSYGKNRLENPKVEAACDVGSRAAKQRLIIEAWMSSCASEQPLEATIYSSSCAAVESVPEQVIDRGNCADLQIPVRRPVIDGVKSSLHGTASTASSVRTAQQCLNTGLLIPMCAAHDQPGTIPRPADDQPGSTLVGHGNCTSVGNVVDTDFVAHSAAQHSVRWQPSMPPVLHTTGDVGFPLPSPPMPSAIETRLHFPWLDQFDARSDTTTARRCGVEKVPSQMSWSPFHRSPSVGPERNMLVNPELQQESGSAFRIKQTTTAEVPMCLGMLEKRKSSSQGLDTFETLGSHYQKAVLLARAKATSCQTPPEIGLMLSIPAPQQHDQGQYSSKCLSSPLSYTPFQQGLQLSPSLLAANPLPAGRPQVLGRTLRRKSFNLGRVQDLKNRTKLSRL